MRLPVIVARERCLIYLQNVLSSRVHGRMGPRTNLEVLNWATGNNEDEAELFFFTVVRNPFDRILSTYRDRILKVCSQSIVDPIIGFFRGSERDLA